MSPKSTVLLILLGLVAIVANASMFVVKEGETAIVFRLGAIQGEKGNHEYPPGLHFKIPFVTEAVKIDRRRQILDSGEEVSVLTNEKKSVTVDHFVVWRVSNARIFFERVDGGDMSSARNLLNKFTHDAISQTFSTRGLVEVISKRGGVVNVENKEEISLESSFSYQDDCVDIDESAKPKVAAVETAPADVPAEASDEGAETILGEVLTKVRENAAAYGMEVVDVRVKSLELDAALNQSIFERMGSEREKFRQLLVSCGETEASAIVTDAKSQRDIKVESSKREAAEMVAKGQAVAARTFNDAYTKNREFYSFYRRLEAYKKSLATGNLIITKPDDEFFKYLHDPYGGEPAPKAKPVSAVAPAKAPAPVAPQPAAKPEPAVVTP